MIQLQDIIPHALYNCGLVPSFNFGDIPADIYNQALIILRDEIIYAINCDTTLDVSVRNFNYTPVTEVIDGFEVRNIYLQENINIPFFPMRIEAVTDQTNGIPYEYLYRSEFDNIDYRWSVFVYSIENEIDGIRLFFRNNIPKRITIPVPITIVPNIYNPQIGEVRAQPKFRQYLIDCLASRLATVYQMATLNTCVAAMEYSLNLLKKNITNPIRPVNRRMQIRETLRNGQSKFWRFDGYV